MVTSVEQPLMQRDVDEDDDNISEINLSSADGVLERDLKSPGLFVWLLTISAGISGLLFGYDTGVISATLVSIGDALGHNLTVLDKSLITSATALFALLISPVSGLLADKFGRKRVVLLADVAFILGALLQAVASSVWVMIIGRSVVGVAVGAGSFVAPLYIAELSPAPFRGRLMTLNVLFITIGQVVAYVVGWAFIQWGDVHTAWRWIVGLGAVPAAIQCLIMAFMPETPRWLVMAGKVDDAKHVLVQVYGKGIGIDAMIDQVLSGIEKEVQEEEQAKRGRALRMAHSDSRSRFQGTKQLWNELFDVARNRRALTIACLLQGLQQLCGFNSLMYFSATIFSMLGFSSPTLTSLSVAITNFIMTCAALVLIDRVGRRRILLYSVPVMSLGLILCAVAFIYIDLPTSTSSAKDPQPPLPPSRIAPLTIVLSIIIYTASYAIGLGNVPWMQSELFPLNVRSLGSAMSTSTNWGANFVVGLTFLPMLQWLTPTWTFVIYSGVCAAGWVVIWKIYPETKGLGLEEVGKLLERDWGVEETTRRQE